MLDYQKRVIAERYQLTERIRGLETMLISYKDDKISFELTRDQLEDLEMQLRVMQLYLLILNRRISKFKI